MYSTDSTVILEVKIHLSHPDTQTRDDHVLLHWETHWKEERQDLSIPQSSRSSRSCSLTASPLWHQRPSKTLHRHGSVVLCL